VNPRYTVVSFHAHPDDEALLTAGTLARAVADGHRVVIVVATDGDAGLTHPDDARSGLGGRRRAELQASAAAIGADRVCFLGYRDSGYDPREVGRTRRLLPESFAALAPAGPASRLADILLEEHADVLTSYDERGGYGHPDHIQVHQVARVAAEWAETPVLLEATLDRDRLTRAVRRLHRVRRIVPAPTMPDLTGAYTPGGELTHRVDVRSQLPAKRGALAAHVTQTEGGESVRTLAMLLRLPRLVRRRALGTEWFREVGREPGLQLLDDIFASLRD
jgi:LmbE family N-acetylglucosaminyl deacetylase